MTDERFTVHFTPLPTAARVTRQRSALRWRVATGIISTIIFVVVMLFWRPEFPLWGNILLGVIWVGMSVFWIIVSAVGLHRAKRDLGRIQQGVSFYVDPEGMQFVEPQQSALRWDEIDEITVKGGRGGAGPRLAVIDDGKIIGEVPFSFLDANASVIDSMIRAHSLGKHRLDARRLELLV